MYLALFVMPWMLMYALSTMAMNHRQFFKELYGGGPPSYVMEKEEIYNGTFPAGATPRMMAEQITMHLAMNGIYNVNQSQDGARITILRHDPVSPRRITYTAAGKRLTVEKQVFRTSAFLERMHRRRGYQHAFPLEDAWASSVDLVIVAMVFWVASGLWMWWEMRVTRRWGALFAAAGLGIFGFFLFTI